MNDSADIEIAANRLGEAISNLESALHPVLSDLSRFEKQISESNELQEDRAALARELDEAKARENALREKQDELSRMADDAIQELDDVIQQVQTALGTKG